MSQSVASRRVVSLPGAGPTDQEPDRLPTPEELQPMEDDILGGLRAAAEPDIVVVPVYRTINGAEKRVFSFRIQSLGQEDYDACRKLALKTQKAKNYGGVSLPTDMDRAMFNGLLVHRATVPEDRTKIWENKKAWAEHGVISPWNLINKVLRNYELEQVVLKIDELSGFSEEQEAERLELAGN